MHGLCRLLLTCAVLALAPGAGWAQQAPLTPAQRDAVETVVKEYILNHPEIVREAMQALQAREEAEKQAAAAKALTERRDDLLRDPRSPVGGNPSGDVTLVAFFDYNCGYCKKVAPSVNAVLEKDGKLRIVYKEFAILGPGSVVAAKAALAAHRQGKYVAFHDALMASPRVDERVVAALAARVGLDHKRLIKDMNDPEIAAELQRNYRLAEALGINGTPSFVIGDRLIPGAVDAGALTALVAAARAQAKPVTQ